MPDSVRLAILSKHRNKLCNCSEENCIPVYCQIKQGLRWSWTISISVVSGTRRYFLCRQEKIIAFSVCKLNYFPSLLYKFLELVAGSNYSSHPKIWFPFLVMSSRVSLRWDFSLWFQTNPISVVSGTGQYFRCCKFQFVLASDRNHFFGMQTKLSSYFAIQIFGSSYRIESKVKSLILLKDMDSGFWSDRAEYSCAEVFLSSWFWTNHFRLIREQGNIFCAIDLISVWSETGITL